MTQQETSYIDYIPLAQSVYEKGFPLLHPDRQILASSAKMAVIIAIADELRKQDELVQLDITETVE